VPAQPIELDAKRLPKRADPPARGEHAAELLSELGYSADEQARLRNEGVVSLR
jgi:crotonobetainyl-CoA:carnitine CoA-transferase CaiB-like acyl-CoA transferase